MLHPFRPWLKPLTGLRVSLMGKERTHTWDEFSALLQLAGVLLSLATTHALALLLMHQ